MTILRMDNVAIVVDDLPAAIAFFVELGLEVEGEATVEGQSRRSNGFQRVVVGCHQQGVALGGQCCDHQGPLVLRSPVLQQYLPYRRARLPREEGLGSIASSGSRASGQRSR